MTNDLIYLTAASAAATAAAATDWSTSRIPNQLTLGSTICGLAMHWSVGGLHGLAASGAGGLVLGAIFLVLYTAGGMGAGDVKLMFAVGCLAGPEHLKFMLATTVASGVMLALIIALRRGQLRQTLLNALLLIRHHGRHGLKPHQDLNLGSTNAMNMPFAIPVAIGCLISLGIGMAR